MTMRGKTLLKGHALRNEGYQAPSMAMPNARMFAECECGAFSPSGLSIKERKQWHREHKASLR